MNNRKDELVEIDLKVPESFVIISRQHETESSGLHNPKHSNLFKKMCYL